MRRIVLFSTPTEANIQQVLDALLLEDIGHKVLAYIPSDGADSPQGYEDQWRSWAEDRGWSLTAIDNSQEGTAAKEELNKLSTCGSVLITGGNTFTLLRNLRRSGLDRAVIEFAQRPDFILAGFSAGAIVLTPTIAVAGSSDDYDENTVGLTDLTGLNLVDFEVFPHYAERYADDVERYRQSTKNSVKTITDEQIIVLDL